MVAIRANLARRLAIQAGDLARSAEAIQEEWTVLGDLTRDPCPHVRFAVADNLADLADAPHALVLTLARDGAFAVNEPVIRLSPVLTEQDLLALIRDPPSGNALVTVARRLGLAQRVADAVAASGDVAGLMALRGNTTAQLSAKTLALLESSARPSALE